MPVVFLAAASIGYLGWMPCGKRGVGRKLLRGTIAIAFLCAILWIATRSNVKMGVPHSHQANILQATASVGAFVPRTTIHPVVRFNRRLRRFVFFHQCIEVGVVKHGIRHIFSKSAVLLM